jgi:hypothetical protein
MPKDKVKARPPGANLGRGALGPTQRRFIVGGILGVLGAGVPQWRLNQDQTKPPPFVPANKRGGRKGR